MTEAKYSWNTRYTNREGYICQLTIRSDESGKDLFDKSEGAIRWLTSTGCTPAGSNGSSASASPATPTCPTHGTPMKESKFGGHYCTSKVGTHPSSNKDLFCDQKVA